jgi:hypothetical protein
MSSLSTISATFAINYSGTFSKITKDAESLKVAMQSNIEAVKGLDNAFSGLSKRQQATIDTSYGIMAGQANEAMSQLAAITNEMSAAYSAQMEAEAQLANNMRNTMGAREEDIKSIKDLCAAQQEIGVIGDEVQLAGAQELATYLEQKESLERLIPVMNDMLAQQYGLNATQESAAQIAQMLGKVMEGQVNALSRYGYKFDEAQKAVLQYGNESERASMLAEVIQQSVGGMNEALAQTDAGKQKQLANTMGDVKEKIGGAVKSIQPYITLVAAATTAVTGITRLGTAFKALGTSLLSTNNLTKAYIAIVKVLGISTATAKAQLIAFSMATSVAQKAVIGLRIAVQALLSATVIGGVLSLLSSLVGSLLSSSDAADDASDSIKELASAKDRLAQATNDTEQSEREALGAYRSTKTLLDINIKRLKDFSGSKAEEKKLVKEMNDTYGTTMKYFSTVSDWYNTLVANSKTYCQQMLIEARIRAAANQITANEELRLTIKDEDRQEADAYAYLERQRDYWHAQKITDSSEWSEYDRMMLLGSFYEEAIERLQRGETVWEEGSNKSKRLAATNLHKDVAPVAYNAIQTIQKLHDPTRQATLKDLDKSDKELEQRITEGYAKAAELPPLIQGSDNRPDNTPTPTHDTTQQKSELEKLNKQIEEKKNAYIKATNEGEKAQINEAISQLQNKKDALEQQIAEAAAPATPTTLNEYDRVISALNAARNNANAPQIVEIDQQIAAYKKERDALDGTSRQELAPDKIKTYAELNDQLSLYNNKLQNAGASERESIQKTINKLNALKEAWDEALSEISAPGENGPIDTLESINKAITYYQKKLQSATADQVGSIQKTINLLNKKAGKIDFAIDLQNDIDEASDISKLEGKELKVKITGIGFDELNDKVKKLKDALKDPDLALSDEQKKQIEALLPLYEQWRKQAYSTFDTYKSGWESLKSFGDGMTSIKEAITEESDAWSKLTGVIDGAMNVFESFKKVIAFFNEMMQIFNITTETSTALKKQEAEQTQEETSGLQQNAIATGVAASMKTALAGASQLQAQASEDSSQASLKDAESKLVDAAASSADATGNITDAAAKIFNAHSWIPWVGVALAAAMTGVMIASMAGLPKFAEGGIISGPTIGLMGEYSGASNNPEVVAPLDKLRSLIGQDESIGGRVKFEIEGRKLVGVIQKENNYRNRM